MVRGGTVALVVLVASSTGLISWQCSACRAELVGGRRPRETAGPKKVVCHHLTIAHRSADTVTVAREAARRH